MMRACGLEALPTVASEEDQSRRRRRYTMVCSAASSSCAIQGEARQLYREREREPGGEECELGDDGGVGERIGAMGGSSAGGRTVLTGASAHRRMRGKEL